MARVISKLNHGATQREREREREREGAAWTLALTVIGRSDNLIN